jgi:ubiquinone/menaquinone biosynthesis C-methylase UbiE
MRTTDRDVTAGRAGLILHSAAGYDFFVWLAMLGKETAFRQKLVALARLQPGESVLDVGCGTGTLAIAAKRRVGEGGSVCGIDASPQMLARAERKAKKAGLDVAFQTAFAQTLPSPDARFDAVLSTVMLHHLPRKARQECAVEMRRVLRPGGRALAVDFATSSGRRGLLTHLHRRHGHVELHDIIAVLTDAGLQVVDSGAVGFRDLQFALAVAPGGPS